MINDKSTKKRRPIPTAIKTAVFKRDCNNQHTIICPICNHNEITEKTSHCCHIISDTNGGETELYNLISGCSDCNFNMSGQNMDEWMKENRPTRRITLESEIKVCKESIKKSEEIIESNLEELKTLPSDQKIWSLMKESRKIYEESNNNMLKINNIVQEIENINKQKIVEPLKEYETICINKQNVADITEFKEKTTELLRSTKSNSISKKEVLVAVLTGKGKLALTEVVAAANSMKPLKNNADNCWIRAIKENKSAGGYGLPIELTKENDIEYVELK